MSEQQQYGPTDIKESALDLIGNTPLVALDRIWPGPGRILGKCEFLNPSGSLKDRSAYYMIQKALESGRLKPGAPIVELTSGNQGCGLALVAAVLGHPITMTMSAGNSPQRAVMMKGLGADIVLVPQVQGQPGKVTGPDAQAAGNVAKKISEETGAYLPDQFNNYDNCEAHEVTTGPEIWRQTGGRVDAFLQTIGTSGAFTGVSKYLKSKNKNVVTVVVEPEGCQAIKGLPITNPYHLMQGSGYGIAPPNFSYDLMDTTIGVSDEEVVKYTKLLGSKEGLYVGYTSGANVAAAVKLLESGTLPKDAWVVTLLNDSGLKYPPLDE